MNPKLDHDCILKSLDRLQEAHWHLHQMELHYHLANPFRYSLTSFLRALKEVPQMVKMELQNVPGCSQWLDAEVRSLYDDHLFSYLAKQRDIAVHRDMITPTGHAHVGTDSLMIPMPCDPFDDSDTVMLAYLYYIKNHGDFFGFLADTPAMPLFVARTWRLKAFPKHNVADLAATAWKSIAAFFSRHLQWRTSLRLSQVLSSCRWL